MIKLASLAVCCCCLLSCFLPEAVGQTVTTMINNGASSNRVDMIFIGDGYQASEIESTYVGHVNATVDSFFNSGINPLPRYRNFFNVHRVNVISNESGADDPASNFFVGTALDATYNTGGTDRCLYFNTCKANTAFNIAGQPSSTTCERTRLSLRLR